MTCDFNHLNQYPRELTNVPPHNAEIKMDLKVKDWKRQTVNSA